jgi:hypothetical protein
VGQTAKELRKMWRTLYAHVLDSIFEECASNEITVGPDKAMDWMEGCFEKLASDGKQSSLDEAISGSTSNLRFDFAAYRRDAHHYAVDRFYKTYFPRKRGAPPLPDFYFDPILRLRFKGWNYAAIADELGLPKERIRKQVPIAEKRWREAMERIEQIKKRFPHLVAREPSVNFRKPQRTPGKQSNRHKVKERPGK